MKRFVEVLIPFLILAGLIAGGWVLVAGAPIDVLQPAGEVAAQQRSILYLTLFLSALVIVPVFTLLITFAWRYRATNTKADYKPDWGENKILEALWWGIPIAIIGILGVVTFQTSHSLDPYKALEADTPALEVQVIAMQWKWLFLYPQQGVATLNHLPVEVNRPIHFTLTADAPMSAFWIPKLGSQIYAMNGMQSELNLVANETGTFTGYTTNINGEGYSDMTFKLKSLSEGAYARWMTDAKSSVGQMDTETYNILNYPESVTEERTYRLTEPDLFDNLVQERMGMTDDTKHGGGH